MSSQPPPHVPSMAITQALAKILPYMSLTIRKDIMTLTRIGSDHRRNRRVRSRLHHMRNLSLLQEDLAAPRVWTGHEILSIIDYFLDSPVKRGLLSILLRCTPVADRNEGPVTVLAGVAKEIGATQTVSRTSSLCYPMLASHHYQAATIPMSQNLPFRPHAQVFMFYRFASWKDNLSRYYYVPQCSRTKTVGRETKELLHAAVYGSLDLFERPSTNPATTADLERWYSETGGGIGGPCEVRSAWKYNDLKPRIYYALGGSAYFAARYVWRIFDSLQRSFKSTDPSSRFSFTRFPFVDFSRQIFMIYDYASFTSNLGDFREFVDQLAFYIRGCKARGFDTYHGDVELDLSTILYEYNSVCNTDGEFDLSRVIDTPDGQALVLPHAVAGMLGVYGNITGSTVLHGLVGIAITGSEDYINTIGDDGAGVFSLDDMTIEDTMSAIRCIGEIADSKFEFWEEDQSMSEDGISWQYVKRPINVEDGMVCQGWMPDFPIYAIGLEFDDGMHTLHPKTLSDRRKVIIRQSIRLIESIHNHLSLVTEADITICIEFLRWLFARLHLPRYGSFPVAHLPNKHAITYPDNLLATPVLIEESFTDGWFVTLKNQRGYGDGYIRVPVVDVPEDVLPSELIPGMSFRCRGDKVLSLVEKLGYVVGEVDYEERLASEETLLILEDIWEGRRHVLTTYHVIEEYPAWTSYWEERYGLE